VLILLIPTHRVQPANDATIAEAGAPEDFMLGPKRDHPPREFCQCIVPLTPIGPAHPSNFVVLTIDVVVAILCTPEFISCQQHRCAMRDQKRC
jgi:hypothetical protein